MTQFQKALIMAASLPAGILAAVGFAAATGTVALSLELVLQSAAVLMIIGFGLFGLALAANGRSYAAVAAMSLALTAAYYQMTSIDAPAPTPLALASVAKGDTASVKREWDGHFRAYANVNGNPVEMLVDTGASLVLLTWEDAQSAGLDMNALNFNAPILTANGRSHVATIELDSVTIGGAWSAELTTPTLGPSRNSVSLSSAPTIRIRPT